MKIKKTVVISGSFLTIQSKDERPHPAVFLITSPCFCIKLHRYDLNTIVYDPFMGIGTTALACIDLYQTNII